MNFHRNRMGQRTHTGARERRFGQETNAARFVEILHDGKRLDKLRPVDFQHRNQPLRVARQMVGSGLRPGNKVHRQALLLKPREAERHAHPVAGR